MDLMPRGLWRTFAWGLLLSLGMQAHAQEEADDGSSAADAPVEEAPAEEADAESGDDEEIDPELDVQGFDPTADDDFIPSEDIPADTPIDFPTDI